MDLPLGLGRSVPALLSSIQQWLANSFFTLFEDPRVAIGLSLLILAAGGLVLLWIVFRIALPAHLALSKLIRAVNGTTSKEVFAADFTTVSEAMTSVGFVRHGWTEFVDTLVFPSEDEGRKIIKNTARPSSYLHLGAAEHAGLHLRFYQAVPNYFVGAGLILTFIGLAAALFFATAGLNQPDPQIAREGLEKLLGAATFKFLTSIAGIVCSILIAFTFRVVSGGLEKKFDTLCDRLEARLQAVTPESIAYDQYRELRKQSTQLERFNTDLAFSIATELDKLLNETLRANIAQVIEPIAKTLDTMSGRFGEMNQDALQRMLGDFQQQLHGAAGTELTNLAASLSSAVSPLRQLAETVEQSQHQIKQTLDVAAKSMRDTAATMRACVEGGARDSMKLMTDSMGRLSTQLTDALGVASRQMTAQLTVAGEKAASVFAPATSAVTGLVQNIDSLQEVMKLQMQHLNQLYAQLGDLVGATSKAADDMRKAGEPSHEAAKRMLTVTDALGKASDTVAKSNQGIHELVAIFATNRADLLKEWEKYAVRFEGVDRDLAKTFETFESGARQYQESVREFFLKMDKELHDALSSLGGGVEGLGNHVEELTEVMESHARALHQSVLTRANLETAE